jgi:hypothetical protein
MAKFLESEKRRLSGNYVHSLITLFEKGVISESEMEKIVDDAETLSGITQKILWKDLSTMTSRFSLTNGEIKSIFERTIYPLLLSNYSIGWLNEQISRNHFTIIERSIKSLLKRVLILDIEIPEYISIDESRRNRIYNFVKRFYKEIIFNNGKTSFIKLHFNHVKTVTRLEIDEDYKNLANQLFDFEINIVEKNLLKV